jgi:hypothetical protein
MYKEVCPVGLQRHMLELVCLSTLSSSRHEIRVSVKLYPRAVLTLGVVSRYTSKVSRCVFQAWSRHFGEVTSLLLLPESKDGSPYIQTLAQSLYCLYTLQCLLLYTNSAQIFQKI